MDEHDEFSDFVLEASRDWFNWMKLDEIIDNVSQRKYLFTADLKKEHRDFGQFVVNTFIHLMKDELKKRKSPFYVHKASKGEYRERMGDWKILIILDNIPAGEEINMKNRGTEDSRPVETEGSFEKMVWKLTEENLPPGQDVNIGNRKGRVIETKPDGSQVIRWFDTGEYEVLPPVQQPVQGQQTQPQPNQGTQQPPRQTPTAQQTQQPTRKPVPTQTRPVQQPAPVRR